MISIVIPCFNAAATLRRTIESALCQDEVCEVIVVDDGSTDASPGIIAEFAGRISAVRTENRGVSAARNLGTSMAVGEFIQYLDSDDVLSAGTLAQRRTALETTGADVAVTDWQEFTTAPDGSVQPGRIVRPDVAALKKDAEIATATSAFWAPPAALLYRASMVKLAAGWPEHMRVVEDARYLFEVARKGGRFEHVSGVGAYYRLSPLGLSRGNRGRFIASCARNTQDIEAIWRARAPLSAEQSQALAGMWWHVASAALIEGMDEFETARRGFNRNAPRRFVIEAGGLLRAVLGAGFVAAMASAGLRVKAAVRRMSALPLARDRA